MTKTITALAAAVTLLAAHSAFAAEMSRNTHTPNASTCQSLETQYDNAAKMHAKAPKFKEAQAAHAEGMRLCGEGKFADGTAKLHSALKDLGVKATRTTH
jgi:hypothetical protein